MAATRTEIQDEIRRMIREATGKAVKGTDVWPGLPEGHLTVARSYLEEMIESGEVEIVERPRKTDPSKSARFVRFTR